MLLRLSWLLACAAVIAVSLAWSLQGPRFPEKVAASPGSVAPSRTVSSEDFARFVDDYLDAFARRHPYDPTYGGYFLGKRAALKLRRDYQAAMSDRFDPRAFHERVMTNGIAPWWAHRALMLPADTGAVD